MYRMLLLALAFAGSLTNLCAQDQDNRPGERKLFDVSADSIDRKFHIDLGKGNSMQLELSRLEDLYHFDNIDSTLLTFLADIKPLQDSLSDPLSAKRIDYLVDAAGRRKIRIRQTRSSGTSYLIDKEGLASLRLEQDTVVMIFKSPLVRMTFYLNDWKELAGYVTSGLSEKLRMLRKTKMNDWGTAGLGKAIHNTKDPSITAEKGGGFTHLPGDYLETVIRVNAQNYQSYFAPSFSLGVELYFTEHLFHPFAPSYGQPTHRFSFMWEPMFFFTPSGQQGKLQVLRNDFVVIGYRHEKYRDPEDHTGGSRINFNPGPSLGFLVYRQGGYFEKNTFRLGLGTTKIWGNAAVLEPCMYFHDFFRNVTPGLRLSVSF